MCEKNGYKLTEAALECARERFETMYEHRSDNFGNGRDVRNLFEDMVSRQADRIAAMDSPTRDEIMTVVSSDLPEE